MNLVGVYTLTKKELRRFIKVPFQTIGSPIITTLLFFLVFGYAIGSRIGDIEGISYGEFIIPGLIMMNIITSAFFGISSAFMLQKFMNTLSELLVSSMSYFEIALGYTLASVIRSLIIGVLIYGTALFFIPFRIDHFFFLLFFPILVSASFSLFGIIIGIWAETFEQVSIFPTFLITPLTFLGGVFYSIKMLPEFAQTISTYNPFLYMINGMRYGFYGVSDVGPWFSVLIVGILFAVLLFITWYLLKIGYKIKT